MPNLPRYTLTKDEKRDDWKLTHDASDRVVRRFETKGDATERGALRDAVGGAGGSVRIQKEDGRYQEERTFPRSRDPKTSKG
jgi:hypothetical protein